MFRILEDFKDYPPSVKKGIVFTVIAWTWFYIPFSMIYNLSDEYTISTREIMIGVCILFLLMSMKNWARVLCLLCNVMASLLIIAVAITMMSMKLIATCLWIEVLLLGISSFFLAIKPSSMFYKKYNQKASDAGETDESR